MELKAFLMSTCSTTQSLSSWESQLSTTLCKVIPTISAAPRTPTPHCRGANLDTSFIKDGVRRRHFPTTRLSVSPTATGRIEESFFFNGTNVDAHMKGDEHGCKDPVATFSARSPRAT